MYALNLVAFDSNEITIRVTPNNKADREFDLKVDRKTRGINWCGLTTRDKEYRVYVDKAYNQLWNTIDYAMSKGSTEDEILGKLLDSFKAE